MSLDTGNRWLLTVAASFVLYQTHNYTISNNQQPTEVDFVWGLTQLAPELFYAFWNPVLQSCGINLRVTGVFCHQTPKAYFKGGGNKKSCELGDLLVVHEHVGSPSRRRALLVQAKMSKYCKPTSTPDQKQEYLYSKWPNLSLSGYGGTPKRLRYRRGSRNLRSNTSGSRYLLIENTKKPLQLRNGLFPNVFNFSKASTSGIYAPSDSSFLLSNMILGKRGYGRKSDLLTENDMSHPKDSEYIAPKKMIAIIGQLRFKSFLK